MPLDITTSGAKLSTPVLTTAPKGTYTTPAKLDERQLFSSEQSTKSITTSLTMFDAIIGVSIIVIIGFIVYLVATSGKKNGK